MPAPSAPSHELVIEAGRTERTYWRDLWRYRELLAMLAWRDVKVRYSQTILGAAWALVQPLASVAILTFVFGRLAKMPAGNEPYFIVVMTGQMAWQLFANALGNTSGSLAGSAHLISKVYFPRLVVPLSTLLVALIDFAIVLLVYALAAGWTATLPSWKVIFLPAFIMTVLLLAFGAGIWLAALTVRFRDFRIVVPFLLQIGVFATPVGYRTDNIPNWVDLLALNPMTGAIDAFRWSLLSVDQFPWDSFRLTLLWTTALLTTGIWYFRRVERTLVDVI
jgi:lipopolysaccharide transport system permease protein